MSILRSERSAAGLLLGAAALGLLLANTPLGPGLRALQSVTVTVPGIGVPLSLDHWVSDGLLAVFFFVVATELRHELTAGQLRGARRALRPAIAALGGVVAPAAVYLALAGGSGHAAGWPVPTATDIAFALGVLAVFGRGLPTKIRVFLLALAVLDDLVAIVIIAIVFAHDVRFGMLGLAAAGVAAFALASLAARRRMRVPVGVLMALIGVLTWELVLASGVHATIAGVALGLALPRRTAEPLTHALEPYTNGLVLPLFAFSAAAVAIPRIPLDELSPAFWGIAVALPVGKFVGILVGGGLGRLLTPRGRRDPPDLPGMIVIATLGGIGFTVALLMSRLAFAGSPALADEGTLAVLVGSAVSMIASAFVVGALARRYRRRYRPATD